jgi:hypothetical protein
MMARAEIAESSFEYLLCEILALDPPNTQEIEQVSVGRSFPRFSILHHHYFSITGIKFNHTKIRKSWL